MEIQESQIEEIKRLHILAIKTASSAAEYARQAGMALMEIKKELKHGEFLSWVEKNLDISVRQVQRYISVAKGKAIPIRLLAGKYDSVSHLEKSRFVPEQGTISMSVTMDENGSPDVDALVESCKEHPNFFFVTVYRNQEGGTCLPLHTSRPVEAEVVQDYLDYFGREHSSACHYKWKVRNGGVMEAGETLFGQSDHPPKSVAPKLSPRKLVFSDGYSPQRVDGKLRFDLTKTAIDGVDVVGGHLL